MTCLPTIRCLRTRLLMQIALMVAMVLALGTAAVLEITALHQDFGGIIRGYRQIREVYEVGHQVALVRALLAANPASAEAEHAADAALLRLERPGYNDAEPETFIWLDTARQQRCIALLKSLKADLASGQGNPTAIAHAMSNANAVLAELSQVSAASRREIAVQQQAADHVRARMTTLAITSAIALVAAACTIGWWQYRSVTRPLRQLSDSLHTLAQGELQHRCLTTGDREFARLAEDLNGMAQQLETLYHKLEQEVLKRTRELVQADRLASIGYLAAGVAHEINNPLAIIVGHTERIARQVNDLPEPSARERLERATRVVLEEAFRCKQITQRLLALARPDPAPASSLPLESLVREVIGVLGDLPRFSNSRITFRVNAADGLTVRANGGEMKQVLINLLVNALEAADDAPAVVEISLTRQRAMAELIVQDSGKGMTPDELQHAFEPFFTSKGRRGTGLGLSISHAIVQAHGGRIFAASPGRGKGSCFTVQLPLAEEVAHAH